MTTPSPWVDAQEVDAALLELEIISDIMMCVQELLAPDRAALALGWLIDRQYSRIAKTQPRAPRLAAATRPGR